jgi:hypothetical protein
MSNPMTKEEAAEFAKHFQVRTMDKDGYHGYYRNEPVQHRKWVGLTDEDCDEVERWVEFKEEGSGRVPNLKLIRYIEAKLKEKNNG